MDFRTWTPFDKQLVIEIKNHMTEAEKAAAVLFGLASGLIVAIFFAIPISMGFTFLRSSLFSLTGVGLLLWLVLGLFVMGYWRHQGKKLLCNTAWAKSQSIRPDML